MIPGVSWNPRNRRWRAVLSGYRVNGYIGEYLTEAEATAARQAAEMLVDGRIHDQAEIEIDGDVARVPLWGKRGVLKGWALIDATDADLIGRSRWSLNPNGYPVARIAGRTPAMHLVLMPGPGTRDHISGDTLDNRRANLRRCSQTENSRNKSPTRNRALYKGVSPTAEGRYRARLMLDRREVWLGSFDTPEEAARAYDAAALQHFGEFARPNFYSEQPGVDIRIEAFAPQAGVAA